VSLQVDFVGHSTLLIELDGVRLLTDPATRGRIGPLRRVVRVPDRHRLGDIDLALISHLHWDHLDVPSLQDLGRNVPVLVPKGAGRWLETAGFRHVTEIALGDRLEHGGLEIEAVPAAHSGFRPPAGPTAQALGYVIRGTRSVYFAGDTDLFPEMTQLAGAIDLALLPVWGWGPVLGRAGHLDPVKAAQSLRLIRPRAAVPIHWGTYWPHAMARVYPGRLLEPPAAFAEHSAELAPDVRTLPTAPGETVELPRW
jgi:L-ascorbate metabolism protein UlaG (beta-lactamase superfamily)